MDLIAFSTPSNGFTSQTSTAEAVVASPSTDQDPVFDHANGTKTSVTTSTTVLAPGTVFVCSNPRCDAVFSADPKGHCPKCIQPNGSGWSTMRRSVGDLPADPEPQSDFAKQQAAFPYR